MRGGVIFDSNGNTVTFVSNSTTFDDSLTVSSINSLLSKFSSNESYATTLMTISATAPTTTSKSSGFALVGKLNGFWYYSITILTAFVQMVIM